MPAAAARRKRKAIRVVILDWNGTTLNDLGLAYKSLCASFRAYGVDPPTLEVYRDEITADFFKFYWRHGVPRRASITALNRIRARVMLENPPPRLQKNARKVLQGLKSRGIPCVVVSAEVSTLLKRGIQRLNVEKNLLFAIGNCWRKRRGILEALHRLGISPKEAMYVGDTADDVFSARAAGVLAVGFTGGYSSRRRLKLAKPDFMMSNLLGIFTILKRLNG